MSKFKCPQCSAEVTKDNNDPKGCPCCGYMASPDIGIFGSIVPYPQQYSYPYTYPNHMPVDWFPEYIIEWVGDNIVIKTTFTVSDSSFGH